MSESENGSHELEWEERWSRWMNAASDLTVELQQLHATNPWTERTVLPEAINFLMTELWDRCFSQTEIREAFDDAVADMPRYAAGDEVRP